MPKYLVHGSYTVEGVKGVRKDGGTKRRQAIEDMLKSAGGRVESFYYALGDSDFFIIADMPDTATAVAVSLAVNATGGAAVKTIPLFTVEEMDAAAKKSIDYRPPGQS